MGDRVNIYFRQKWNADGPLVVLYSHWGGYNVDQCLAEAIQHAKPRWDDDSYGTRMIISHILKDDLLDQYGYGIYAIPSLKEIRAEENGYRVVDFNMQTVWGEYGYSHEDEEFENQSFEHYVKFQLTQ